MKTLEEGIIYLNDKDIQDCITIKDVIECVEQTYLWFENGKIIMPAKITVDMKSLGLPNFMNAMPAYVEPYDTIGIKWVGGFAENPKIGLPYIRATLMINNPKTGQLRAIMAGDWISQTRTGAQAAIAAKYLAARDTKIATIIGAGIQGISALKCLCHIFKFDEVRISDISIVDYKKTADEIEKIIHVPVRVCAGNQEAAGNADVIVTATPANARLVKNEWVKPGATVITLGTYQEVDDELILKSEKRVVDHLEQCTHRGSFGELFRKEIINKSSINAQIGEIIVGKQLGRENDTERIIVSLVGMGCLDVSIATMAYERAIKKGELSI